MKRFSASFLFFVYLSFFALIYANAYVEQHNNLCDAETALSANTKTDAHCCDHSFISGKIKHEAHPSAAAYKHKFLYTNYANDLVANEVSYKRNIYRQDYTSPLLSNRIFLNIRVLLI